jgi:chorismate mutase
VLFAKAKIESNLNVTTTAVDVLRVFHLILDHEILALVRERLELGRNTKEASILTSLDT